MRNSSTRSLGSFDQPMARLLVIGTGLIGGSFALAMRKTGCFAGIDGHDSDPMVAEKARQLGLIDGVVTDLRAAIDAVDAVLIAVPTGAIAAVVRQIESLVGRRTVTVFDTGSTKASVIEALRRGGAVPPWFVPSHPMAGSERQGPEAADAELFRGRRVFVTPQPETAQAAVEQVRGWWAATGAEVIETSVEIHDEMVALTSHLPHLIAFAFMNWVARPHGGDAGVFAGPGLLGFTRIAGSDASMWRGIMAENRLAVLAQYDGWTETFATVGTLLRESRFNELEAFFAAAQVARLRLPDESRE